MNTTHGQATNSRDQTPEYTAWQRAKSRCYCEGDTSYYNYGGRGIKMCDEWVNSFQAFFDFIGKKPTKSHSLDRIDCDGNYEPSNCRWATRKAQNRNTRRNFFIEYNGETKCLSEWAELYSVDVKMLYLRIRRYKWSMGKALTKPSSPFNAKLNKDQIIEIFKLKGLKPQRQIAKEYNITQANVGYIHRRKYWIEITKDI